MLQKKLLRGRRHHQSESGEQAQKQHCSWPAPEASSRRISQLTPEGPIRIVEPFRSKLAAAILGGVDNIHIAPGKRVRQDFFIF